MRTSAVPTTVRCLARSLVVVMAGLYVAACSGDTLPSPEGARGLAIARENGCLACHVDSDVGPGWEGLAGSEVELSDGTTIVANREYLRRSIREPQADTVAGYTILMPTAVLTDSEVDALVAYIEELR